MKFIVIGISDAPLPFFPPEVLAAIRGGRVFSGGRRHHEIVAPLLPAGARWVDITAPLDNVFRQYDAPEIVVFASGDPLFFGFANTIRRRMPEAEVVVYPSFNSLQLLAHRLLMPYHDMRIVSLTGRPWQAFDRALIEGVGKMGVLTDREHTPRAIARRMLDYGYDHYEMHVGERLGNPAEEKLTSLTVREAVDRDFDLPNCLILDAGEEAAARRPPYGIPDGDFGLLDGREKMITKMPIRLLDLQALGLRGRRVLWDVGACTGSVSIEARLLFPHLHVDAFEIRPECEAIIHGNARRFGAPGIDVHIGDFLETDLEALPRPDAVFIGGHGGRLREIMARVQMVLADDGVVVMNSVRAPRVTLDSHRLWDEVCADQGWRQDPPTSILLNEHHPITILRCRR